MIINGITHSYKKFNEDIYGSNSNSCWILDGALSLNCVNVTNHSNDVVWVVKWWNEYLKENLNQMDKSIFEILEEGIDALNEDFGEFVDIDSLSKLDRASAAIVIFRKNGSTLEFFVLGDTEINIMKRSGELITLIDEKIEDLDNQVMNMIYNNRERQGKITFNGYTDEELKVLRNNRMKMNCQDGYYILEHDRQVIRKGIYREYESSEIQEMLLMSDGFSAIYNKYHELNLKDLFQVRQDRGLEYILNQIRHIENTDPDFKQHKRLRQHDDATAVYICMND
jgi:hypothetical protein